MQERHSKAEIVLATTSTLDSPEKWREREAFMTRRRIQGLLRRFKSSGVILIEKMIHD